MVREDGGLGTVVGLFVPHGGRWLKLHYRQELCGVDPQDDVLPLPSGGNVACAHASRIALHTTFACSNPILGSQEEISRRSHDAYKRAILLPGDGLGG